MMTMITKQQQQQEEGWQQAWPQRGRRDIETAGKWGDACWHGILLFYDLLNLIFTSF